MVKLILSCQPALFLQMGFMNCWGAFENQRLRCDEKPLWGVCPGHTTSEIPIQQI